MVSRGARGCPSAPSRAIVTVKRKGVCIDNGPPYLYLWCCDRCWTRGLSMPIRESITTRSYSPGEKRNPGRSFSPNVLPLFLSFSSKLTFPRHRMLGHGCRPCVQVQLDPKTCCELKQRIRRILPYLNFPLFSSVGYGFIDIDVFWRTGSTGRLQGFHILLTFMTSSPRERRRPSLSHLHGTCESIDYH